MYCTFCYDVVFGVICSSKLLASYNEVFDPLFFQAVQIKGCRSITFRLVDSLKRKGILVDVLSLQSQLNNSSPPVQI